MNCNELLLLLLLFIALHAQINTCTLCIELSCVLFLKIL